MGYKPAKKGNGPYTEAEDYDSIDSYYSGTWDQQLFIIRPGELWIQDPLYPDGRPILSKPRVFMITETNHRKKIVKLFSFGDKQILTFGLNFFKQEYHNGNLKRIS